MNLVVIGSCSSSSTLAKTLNERLSNSIVYRHDLLAGLKTMPLGTDSYPRTVKESGFYLGDIETIDFSRVPNSIFEKTLGLFKFLSGADAKSKDSFERFLISDSLDKFTKRIVTFNSASLKVINIFSGITTGSMLSEIAGKLNDCLVVEIRDDSKSLLPIEITQKELDAITTIDSCMYLGKYNSIDALFKSEEFKTLFGDFKENEVEPEECKKEATDYVEEEVPVGIVHHLPPPFRLNGYNTGMLRAVATAA